MAPCQRNDTLIIQLQIKCRKKGKDLFHNYRTTQANRSKYVGVAVKLTIGSYISMPLQTWEVWRALKKLELLSATPRATLMHLSCSPNFLCASYLDEHTAGV